MPVTRVELTRCNFCGKPARSVEFIIQTNTDNIGICNECIVVAQELIDEKRSVKKFKVKE